MITQEDVEKAKAAFDAAFDAAGGVSADWDAFDAAEAAWDKYIELKREFQNARN